MAETLEVLIAHLERKGDERLVDALDEVRLEQGIGVIYHPETERVRHYFEALLPQQFDVIIHLDEIRAVEPVGPHRWMGRGRAAGDVPHRPVTQETATTPEQEARR
jgi:hypothetical protein